MHRVALISLIIYIGSVGVGVVLIRGERLEQSWFVTFLMLSTTISFSVAIITGFFALISSAFNKRHSIFRRIVTVVVILIGFAVPAWIGFVMYVGMKTHQNSARRHSGNETIHKRISDIVLKSYL